MYILGIGGLGYKDASAALLSDGRVVAAVAEERFSGTKHQGGFPHRALSFCLERAGISLRECACVAVADNPWLPMRDKVLRWYGEDFLRSRTAKVYHVFRDESHDLVDYLKTLEQIASQGVEVQQVPHDVSHMAAAYFGSPWQSAALLVIDGRGEVSTSGIGKGAGGRIDVYSAAQMPDSLGLLYALVADYLGFSELDDEFRLISISPTGTPTFMPKMRELVRLTGDGGYRLNAEFFGYHQGRAFLSERFTDVFGPPRDPNVPIEDRHRDLAASIHAVIVEVVLSMARAARERSGEDRLCLGGGLAQNWAFAGAIGASGLFGEMYVPPCPGDEGTALGAALYAHHVRFRQPHSAPLLRADLGPSFSEEEIAAELARFKLRASRPADLPAAVAERIAAGQIVGWFQGCAEFSRRALGHRSILADPTDPGTRARLVASVKARSEFHPFGLSILREAAAEWIQDAADSPFLDRTGLLRPEARRRLPAVAAPEGRARYQTVDGTREPLFHELLRAVGRKTGVPAVLNTSLNEPGNPMATTPREAIACLYTSGLDALAIGPFVLAK